jgi:hypothetical protein
MLSLQRQARLTYQYRAVSLRARLGQGTSVLIQRSGAGSANDNAAAVTPPVALDR